MSAATSLRPPSPSGESPGRRARKALLRDIDRDLKAKAKTKIVSLRTRLQEARAAHREALKSAVTRCQAHRLAVREKLQAERAQALAELRAKGEAERAAARGGCSLDKGTAQKATRGSLEDARAALHSERSYQEDLRRIERGNRTAGRVPGKKSGTTATERRSESDDEVRNTIPPELVSLFNKVKRSIKATPRETRSEVFLRYAEEHPREYLEAIDDQTEALIRDLERQQREAPRQRRNPAPRPPALPSNARALPAADPRIPSVALGELVAVIYRTPGGDTRHAFQGVRPVLTYNASGLLIAGGSYSVDGDRIVG